MGDYADFINDGLMDNYFNEIDNPDNYEDDYPQEKDTQKYSHGTTQLEFNSRFNKINRSLLKVGDEWLYRKGISGKVNEVVKIVRITDKAVLFEFVEEWKNRYNWEMKGKQFWYPLSILYKHKNEIKVIYVPHWATCKLINVTEEERKNI